MAPSPWAELVAGRGLWQRPLSLTLQPEDVTLSGFPHPGARPPIFHRILLSGSLGLPEPKLHQCRAHTLGVGWGSYPASELFTWGLPRRAGNAGNARAPAPTLGGGTWSSRLPRIPHFPRLRSLWRRPRGLRKYAQAPGSVGQRRAPPSRWAAR